MTSSFAKNAWVLLAAVWSAAGCVDPDTPNLTATVDIIVVDGTLNNLAEPQIVTLNRSRADPKTGRFGSLPLTGLRVELVVDSIQSVAFRETTAGTYQLPDGFRGLVGHRYQLRFSLENGARYESVAETLRAAPPVEQLSARFNSQSLNPTLYNGFRAAHDVTLTTKDPVDQHNYYRWDWVLYEKQNWCRSCYQGVYAVYTLLPHQVYIDDQNRGYFVSGNQLLEECFAPKKGDPDYKEVFERMSSGGTLGEFTYDYQCRTRCWEIVTSTGLVLFDDLYTNGAALTQRVAQVPFFTHNAALVEIRQTALSKEAYQFYKLVEDQIQNTGGLADTPPVAPVGNVRNVANPRERVVGYFAAAGVSAKRHWLDRKDASGATLGTFNSPADNPVLVEEELFVALNGRRVSREPPPPYVMNRFPPAILIFGGPPRVPTAVCVPGFNRTPVKPEGWRD